jgi:hypothetical protein
MDTLNQMYKEILNKSGCRHRLFSPGQRRKHSQEAKYGKDNEYDPDAMHETRDVGLGDAITYKYESNLAAMAIQTSVGKPHGAQCCGAVFLFPLNSNGGIGCENNQSNPGSATL